MIYIITTCTRPENLEVIKKTIPSECTWVVVFDKSVQNIQHVDGAINLDSPYTGYVGMPNRNYALDAIGFNDLDWIYVLDDDNVIHPDWYEAVKSFLLEEFNHVNMVTWGQIWRNNSVRLEPTSFPRVGNIDTSSYMVRGRLMRALRYAMDYCADGILAEQAATFGNIVTLPKYLGYSNFLRTPEDRMH